MKQAYTEINDIIASDPGRRIFPAVAPRADLDAVTRELAVSRRVFVLTGFPIKAQRTGETDGPPGAANLARLMHMLGKEVWVVTDPYSYAMMQSACMIYAPDVPVLCAPFDNARQFCLDILKRHSPTHIISIERPGKNAGHFHSMAGEVLDDMVADTDYLFSAFGGVKIAVGDGGNELGMGIAKGDGLKAIPNGEKTASQQPADHALAAGISNWWGWGMAALLSIDQGRDLLPTEEQERQLLEAVVSAGGMDSGSRRRILAVDGVSLEDNLKVLKSLREIVNREIGKGAG